MVTAENVTPDESQEKDWENPQAPEESSDARNNEQAQRQHDEAKRRHDNLTETDHIDKPEKPSN